MRIAIVVAAGAVVLGAAGPRLAAAQPATATAEQLFRDGKRLLGEGKIAEACTAFEGSYRKEAVASTLLNLADCREKNQQYASAWGRFIEAERMTRANADQAGFNQTARDRARKLEPRLSYLIINVPDESRVDGLEITRNGVAVDPAEWNRDSPVDGGEYTIEGKAPAYEPWSTTVTVGAERDKQSVNVPKFHALPPDQVDGGGSDMVPVPVDHGGLGGKRIGAMVAGGVGLAALGGGVALYLSARSTYDDSKHEPDDQRQTELYDSANRKYLFAQIAWGVGAAAIGAGAYLWFTGGTSHERAVTLVPSLGPSQAGMVVSGRF